MNRNNRTYEKCGSVLLREIKSVAVIKSKEVMGVFSELLAGLQMPRTAQFSGLGEFWEVKITDTHNLKIQ